MEYSEKEILEFARYCRNKKGSVVKHLSDWNKKRYRVLSDILNRLPIGEEYKKIIKSVYRYFGIGVSLKNVKRQTPEHTMAKFFTLYFIYNKNEAVAKIIARDIFNYAQPRVMVMYCVKKIHTLLKVDKEYKEHYENLLNRRSING